MFYGSLPLVYWPHRGLLLFYLFGLKWVGHQCYRIFPTISGTVFKPHNSVLSNTENKPVYWPHPCINHSLFNRSRLKNEMPYSGASATNNLKVLWSRDGHFKQKYYTQSLHQYTQTQLKTSAPQARVRYLSRPIPALILQVTRLERTREHLTLSLVEARGATRRMQEEISKHKQQLPQNKARRQQRSPPVRLRRQFHLRHRTSCHSDDVKCGKQITEGFAHNQCTLHMLHTCKVTTSSPLETSYSLLASSASAGPGISTRVCTAVWSCISSSACSRWPEADSYQRLSVHG